MGCIYRGSHVVQWAVMINLHNEEYIHDDLFTRTLSFSESSNVSTVWGSDPRRQIHSSR